MGRKWPNIAIAGVPGTGKTTLAKKLNADLPKLKYLNLGDEAKRRGCEEGNDSKLQTVIIDEDKLSESLSPELEKGGHILDWIHADLFGDGDLLDLVVILRASTERLFDVYKQRSYPENKIQNNLDAEIFNEIGAEVEECYGDSESTETAELQSNTDQDMEANLTRIKDWIKDWQAS